MFVIASLRVARKARTEQPRDPQEVGRDLITPVVYDAVKRASPRGSRGKEESFGTCLPEGRKRDVLRASSVRGLTIQVVNGLFELLLQPAGELQRGPGPEFGAEVRKDFEESLREPRNKLFSEIVVVTTCVKVQMHEALKVLIPPRGVGAVGTVQIVGGEEGELLGSVYSVPPVSVTTSVSCCGKGGGTSGYITIGFSAGYFGPSPWRYLIL